MNNQKKMSTIAAGIAMVGVTAMSLGTATFAWFTRGTTAQATGFDFTASAATGIEMSTTAEAGSWGSTFTAGDFDTASGPQAGNRVSVSDMEPVSTVNSVGSGNLTFYTATSVGDIFNVTSDNSNFLMFDLYFNNTGTEDLTLRLDGTSQVVDGLVDNDTSLTTRVAFINQGTDTLGNAQGGSLTAVRGGNSAYFWEPNSLARTGSAISKAATNNAKYDYYGMASTGSNLEKDYFGNIDYNEGTLVNSTNDLAIGDSDVLTTLSANLVTKVTIYVWMEGQDIDNDNSVSAGDVTIDLNFDTAEPSGAFAQVVTDNAATSVAGTDVTLAGTSTAGADYSAYALLTSADSHNNAYTNLNHTVLVASGTAQAVDATLAAITLNAAGDTADTIVVTGILDSYVSSRTTYAN